MSKCDQAVDRLVRAEKLFHAPTILGRLGECQIALGKLVEGTEALQRVVREPLGSGAPAAFVAARARAQEVLDTAVPRLARLTLDVKAPVGVTVTVRFDDARQSEALIGVAHPADPGEHTVEATAPGYLKATQKVTLAEGQSATATLSPQPDPAASKPVVVAPPVERTPSPQPTGSSAVRTAGWVTLGVGAAGVAVGATLGALALSKKEDLDSHCQDQRCAPTYGSELDAARLDGTLSTVAFVAEGLGVAAGLTLLLWPSSGPEKGPEPTVQPVIGWGFVGARGDLLEHRTVCGPSNFAEFQAARGETTATAVANLRRLAEAMRRKSAKGRREQHVRCARLVCPPTPVAPSCAIRSSAPDVGRLA